MRSMKPIDDGKKAPGHFCNCDGCGKRGVYCESDFATIFIDGEEVEIEGVEIDGENELLLTGKFDGSESDKLFCETCATNIELD